MSSRWDIWRWSNHGPYMDKRYYYDLLGTGKPGVQIKKYTCVTSHIIVLDVPFMHHMVWSRHAQINFTTVNYQSFETPLVASICANVSDMSKE